MQGIDDSATYIYPNCSVTLKILGQESMASSTKRETALSSLLEKLREWMISTTAKSAKRTSISGERGASLRVWIVRVITVVEALT